MFFRKGVAEKIEVERERFYSDLPSILIKASLMETVSSTTIIEVLPPERPKRQRVSMKNNRLGNMDHSTAVLEPAITKLPVFCGSAGKGFVESTNFPKTFCR